jgi:hypothetical protein
VFYKKQILIRAPGFTFGFWWGPWCSSFVVVVVFLCVLRSVSLMPNFTCISGLSILDFHFSFQFSVIQRRYLILLRRRVSGITFIRYSALQSKDWKALIFKQVSSSWKLTSSSQQILISTASLQSIKSRNRLLGI